MLKIASAQMNWLLNSELIPSSFHSSSCTDGQITNNCGLTEELLTNGRVALMNPQSYPWYWTIHNTHMHSLFSLFNIALRLYLQYCWKHFSPFLWTVKTVFWSIWNLVPADYCGDLAVLFTATGKMTNYSHTCMHDSIIPSSLVVRNITQ